MVLKLTYYTNSKFKIQNSNLWLLCYYVIWDFEFVVGQIVFSYLKFVIPEQTKGWDITYLEFVIPNRDKGWEDPTFVPVWKS